MVNYYNEHDPDAAEWLRELIRMGEIPPGDVDERSIEDVLPTELAGYTQCHFFAGIGGWPLALRLAGWPDDRPVWTGSCPCQPFSAAGQRKGTADERHLWPAFWWLVAQCGPATVYGEQVASKAGREWLAGVRADLETLGYAVGAADLCAAGVGAPHIRQRLFWMAHAENSNRRRGERGAEKGAGQDQERGRRFAVSGSSGRMGDSGSPRSQEQPWRWEQPERSAEAGGNCGISDTTRERRREARSDSQRPEERIAWGRATWIPCADGKARRIEPGIEPLVDGLPRGVVPGGHIGLEEAKNSGEARAMRLKGYGNGIVPQVAAEFVMASVGVSECP